MEVQPTIIKSSYSIESSEYTIQMRTKFEDDIMGRGDEKVGVFFYETESFLDDDKWNGTFLTLNEHYDKDSTDCIFILF